MPPSEQATALVAEEAVVVAVVGELDLADAPALARRLDVARGTGREVVVDLREMTFIDSSGLAVLVWAAQATGRARQRLRLLPPPPPVMRTFEVTGLRALLPFDEG